MMATGTLKSTLPEHNKRKHESDTTVSAPKKRPRVGKAAPSPGPRLPLEPHQDLLDELRPKYDVATFSVLSSTSINKRIDQILAQLGRFHPTDLTVLPGVVLMHAKSGDVAKMVSVIELVRRQIHERGQKWYQYNRVYEVENDSPLPSGGTVVEETVLHDDFPDAHGRRPDMKMGVKDSRNDDEKNDGEDDECFEVAPSVFERAVMGPQKPEHRIYMSIFLSRVPISELDAKSFITSQSNTNLIDTKWRQDFGG